jgi:Metalloenzyme superfamily
MKFKITLAFVATILLLIACSQPAETIKNDEPKVFLLTLDGLRWQELFSGIDSSLMNDEQFTSGIEGLKSRFWDDDQDVRKEKLMPFFWNTIVKEGQLYGNRWEGSEMNATNNFWFSYPGYNEILTGFADDENIKSNEKINNLNVTALEFVNKQAGYEGKVAAFASWDVFPYIINAERSGIPVNAGFGHAVGNDLTEKELFLNKLQDETPSPWGTVRLDVFTHNFALEHIKKTEPKLVYISYGETDDFAHNGDYANYIKSANRTDQFINDLWDFIQSSDYYKDNTTIIITTDHGRGTVPKGSWRGHGTSVEGADQIWAAAIGPRTNASGLVKGQFYQNQVARTVVEALGLKYDQPKAGAVISEMIK